LLNEIKNYPAGKIQYGHWFYINDLLGCLKNPSHRETNHGRLKR